MSFSQTHTARTVNIPGANCGGYYEYLPVGYNSNNTTKYPVLIYIHGNGAYGNGSASAMNIVLQEGVPRIINLGQFPTSFTVNGQTTSYIVISPQFFSRASPLQTKNFIDYILNSNYRIDLNRVYLTGFSVGGDVAWKTPLDLPNATRLAALCPVAGYNNPYTDTTAQFIAAGNLPVWAIHSNSDGVPVAWSQDMVDKINSYNPITPAIISRPNNITHENTHIVVYDPGYRPNGKNIYEWCLQYSRNYPPIAIAGPDQNLVLPINQTFLTSAGSVDPDGTAITFLWNKINGPSQYQISNNTLPNPLISNLLAGVYQFQLKVTDGDGQQAYDTVQVTVTNPNPNQPPIADAGNDETIYLPQNSATLIGSNSHDPDGVIEEYAWQKISGPSSYTFTNPASASTNVINLQVGTYQFKLTVTDNEGAITSDTVETTVINPFPNIPPVANAGNSQSIALPVNSVQLDGSGSTDTDGLITSYLWRQINGPSVATLSTPNLAITSAQNLLEGLYQFELQVMDDSSSTDKDTVSVVVNPAPAITQKYVKVNLYSGSNGAGTDWNNWNVQSNLNLNSTIYSDGSPSPIKATLSVSYGVADNGVSYPITMCPVQVGRTASYSTVNRWIDITDLDNNKSYDLEVYGSRSGSATNSTRYLVGGSSVVINTTGNYSNKAIFSNLTPTGGTIRLDMQRLNTYNYINGFIITEKTSNGGGGTSNTAPVAVPGNNQEITLPVSTITLNGSASYDPDGSIVGYSWT
ncbi:MAG TPA: PKD domain-containing protein, partial [Chitinophagaceae bacterium]|nr:PKD domain-containing protein [Chitinophagaceae bacterium]